MKSFTVAALAMFFSLIGCAESHDPIDARAEAQEEDVAAVDQSLTPAGGDQCGTVDTAAIDAVLALVELAQYRADDVLAAHPNVPHTYLAQYLVNDLASVHATLTENKTWLMGPASDNQPGQTNYVEGLGVYQAVFNSRANLEEARWYAILSTVHLSDDDAYFAFEDISLATELANDLATRGARCYLNAYGFPSAP